MQTSLVNTSVVGFPENCPLDTVNLTGCSYCAASILIPVKAVIDRVMVNWINALYGSYMPVVVKGYMVVY